MKWVALKTNAVSLILGGLPAHHPAGDRFLPQILAMPYPSSLLRNARTVTSVAAVLVWFTFAASHGCAADVSFSHDVMAVLSKAGCNMGACHGNAKGKGGFRLSLRGQDPAFDHAWLVRESGGRRIDRLRPAQSLILLKPTGKTPHQGGTRFPEGSPEYQILTEWITAGAAGPQTSESRLERLEVAPQYQVLVAPQASLPLQVTAIFSDGARRDVTTKATYETSNLSASVDHDGVVHRDGFGQSTVVVRYLDQQTPARIAFVPERADFVWGEPPENNFIDRLLFAQLRQLKTNPSPLAADHVFIRRAYLDAVGVLPTAEEARAFVADPRTDKRKRLIDQLLWRSEFADHWALKWADLLRVEEKVLDDKGVEVFHAWIRRQIADDVPLNTFVRDLVRADGSTYKNPPANFWRANRSPTARGETTARLFLGVRLQCAKCHNHPFDRWTQDDYYSWAAVFAKIDYEIVDNKRADKLDKNEFNGEQVVVLNSNQGVNDPRTGRRVASKLLGDRQLGPGAYQNRLVPLAVWLTSADNRQFAQAQANMVWYHLMGRGLVEPIDDFRATNPAVYPEVLDALAADFAAQGFNLRHLVRTIMNSAAYQLAAAPLETATEEAALFSHAHVQRLPAEKLLDAQSSVLGTPARFAGFDLGLHATQLPGVNKERARDAKLPDGDRFLKVFGKPERLLACECERSNETTLAQAFALIGGSLNRRLAEPGNRIDRMCGELDDDARLVDQLYWTVLGRPPDDRELTAGLALLSTPATRFANAQDLAWALMNSKEFIFRH